MTFLGLREEVVVAGVCQIATMVPQDEGVWPEARTAGGSLADDECACIRIIAQPRQVLFALQRKTPKEICGEMTIVVAQLSQGRSNASNANASIAPGLIARGSQVAVLLKTPGKKGLTEVHARPQVSRFLLRCCCS